MKQIFAEGALGVVSGVASSLPAGAVLGDRRVTPSTMHEYQLFYNGSAQTISKGTIFGRNAGSAVGTQSDT